MSDQLAKAIDRLAAAIEKLANPHPPQAIPNTWPLRGNWPQPQPLRQPHPAYGQQTVCTKCGATFGPGPVGYVCPDNGCPTFAKVTC